MLVTFFVLLRKFFELPYDTKSPQGRIVLQREEKFPVRLFMASKGKAEERRL